MRGFLGTGEFVEVVAQHTRNVLYFPIIHELERLHDPTFSDRTRLNWEKRERSGTAYIKDLKRGGSEYGEFRAAVSEIGQKSARSRKLEKLLEICMISF